MTNPMNRRAALGSLAGAAGVLFASPRLAKAESLDALEALISTHEKARLELGIAGDALEEAKPDPQARVVGVLECDYALGNGKDRIAAWIEAHFQTKAKSVEQVGTICPAFASDALDALRKDRDAALARLDEAFAAQDAADRIWDEMCDVEIDALLAISAHRCGSPEELARKFRYLWAYRSEMEDKGHLTAMFLSFLPPAQAAALAADADYVGA